MSNADVRNFFTELRLLLMDALAVLEPPGPPPPPPEAPDLEGALRPFSGFEEDYADGWEEIPDRFRAGDPRLLKLRDLIGKMMQLLGDGADLDAADTDLEGKPLLDPEDRSLGIPKAARSAFRAGCRALAKMSVARSPGEVEHFRRVSEQHLGEVVRRMLPE